MLLLNNGVPGKMSITTNTYKTMKALNKQLSNAVANMANSGNSAPTRTEETEKAEALMKRFGSLQRFMDAFSPLMMRSVAEDPGRAYYGNAPALGTVRLAFGGDADVVWLKTFVDDFAGFYGTSRMNDENKTRVAMMMSVKSHLRVTEFMLFFWKLCNADYGKVFGSVDASYILTAFKSFLKERTNELSQYAVTSTEDVDVSIDSHVIRPQELWRMAMKGELAPDVADGVLDMLGPYDERGNLLPSSKRRPR